LFGGAGLGDGDGQDPAEIEGGVVGGGGGGGGRGGEAAGAGRAEVLAVDGGVVRGAPGDEQDLAGLGGERLQLADPGPEGGEGAAQCLGLLGDLGQHPARHAASKVD